MHSYLLDSLAKTASYLNELREPLLRDLMQDFYIAVDSYISCVRDIPQEAYATSVVRESVLNVRFFSILSTRRFVNTNDILLELLGA